MRPSLVRGAPGLASPSQTTGWRLDTHNDLADLSLLKSPFVHSRVAQLVEQPAVNRLVAGSSPAAGALPLFFSYFTYWPALCPAHKLEGSVLLTYIPYIMLYEDCIVVVNQSPLLSISGGSVEETLFLPSLKKKRVALGLSQAQLAARTGVSRQALGYIEAGKQVPSTRLALELAHSLHCSVDDLFQLASGPVVFSRPAEPLESGERVVLGRVGESLVAHPLHSGSHPADGVLQSPVSGKGKQEGASVELLSSRASVDGNVLVAGCAPLLGLLCGRLERRYADMRATWIPADSSQALALLENNLVHVAGIHLASSTRPEAHLAFAKRTLAKEKAVLVNLATWRQGLLVAPGNPFGIESVADLMAPDVRYARRNKGSGAQELLVRLMNEAGTYPANESDQPLASSHAEIAQLVGAGVVTAGVAIEAVAISEGLGFVPLSEERFDLVLAETSLDRPELARFISLIDQPSFRSDASRLPGYDLSLSGHLSTLSTS